MPEFDSAVAAAVREAGAVLIGKNNMFELSTGWGTASHFPFAVNPWNADRSPGGSSSGSAVAVASGLGPVSIGSDSGGSVRVPANYCGIVGLKPTYGLISSFGTIPVGPRPATSASWLDRRKMPHMCSKFSTGSMRAIPPLNAPRPRYSAELTGDASGIRIGVPWNYIGDHITDENAKAFAAALSVLRDAGATVNQVELANTEGLADAWSTIVFAELAAFHEEEYRRAPENFSFELHTRMDSGLATTAVQYVKAQDVRYQVRRAQLDALASVDLIATPSAPGEAPPLSQVRAREHTARQTNLADTGQLARYTRPYNLSGLPAMTLPSGFTSTDMPLGLQLAARPLEESLILRVAEAFQRRTSWHAKRPTVGAMECNPN